jgi:ADP-heptose:LPS heptosyltransferase
VIEEIRKHSDIICNDSGPSHLAELLGKRTFTLFGPANPAVHKKHNHLNYIIREIISCSPAGNEKLCFANGGRDCPSNVCMQRISVDKTYESIISI